MNDDAIRQIAARLELDDAIVAEALDWLVLMRSGEASNPEVQELAAWRAADRRHDDAYRALERLDDRLGALQGNAAAGGLRAADRAVSRRGFLTAAVGLLAGGAGFYSARGTRWMRGHLADYRTGVGEIRRETLPDGTGLVLNTDTAVNARFDGARRLTLISGEIRLKTGHAPPHGSGPLIVATADGTVRPVGTRFSVRRTDHHSRVAVEAGAVQLRPASVDQQARLDAGGVARLSQREVERLPGARATADWVDARLSVSQMRLDALVAELARYRPGILEVEPAVADERVSGTFPLDDTDRALAALGRALPVRVRSWTRYWVSVAPR